MEQARRQWMTLAEHFKTEDIRQGMQETIRQGEYVMLLRQVKKKFPYVSATYLQRIEQASEKYLLKWGERLLDAETLEDVFKEE